MAGRSRRICGMDSSVSQSDARIPAADPSACTVPCACRFGGAGFRMTLVPQFIHPSEVPAPVFGCGRLERDCERAGEGSRIAFCRAAGAPAEERVRAAVERAREAQAAWGALSLRAR